ncbi:MAG TPA: DUF3662 and FHA domain-containing protein [Candidatus Baltobacteraceae bacterium]
MSWLARIEEACAGFIERAFANMFPSDVEPAQIARKLVATMEARTQPSENGAIAAPARYVVFVHSADYERLLPHRAYLEEEWTALLQDIAQRVGITFLAPPAVELRSHDDMVAGAIEIDVTDGETSASNAITVLRIIAGMPAGARFAVTKTLNVGRRKESDIFLVDPSVSRNHAVLELQGDHIVVRDCGSTNGTFVNGERVQLRTLHAGDVVAFGKTQMAVEADNA